MDSDSKCTVLVTGFGPFDNHATNASWAAVKELSKLSADSEKLKNVKVIIEEIPVLYEHVANYVPKLWKKHNPTIVLHVGVSHKAQCLTIECCAHSKGYVRPDIHDRCPDESNITLEVLKTGVDVNRICESVNEHPERTRCSVCISHDAGRYLCEYIFYESLKMDPTRVLFVHVPDFDRYSTAQTAKGLHDLLCCLIKNVKNVEV